jgi:hypothetical protein
VDSVWEQEKLEARKMLENAARKAPSRPLEPVLGSLISSINIKTSLSRIWI